MKIGSSEMEVDMQTLKTKEDQDPRTTTPHQETENERPERSRDSTIHTLRQFLVDSVFQVLNS
jgi:midasin